MGALIVTLCKVMAVRQFALLLGVSDRRTRRTRRTLDYYEAQTHAQEDFSNVTAVGLGRDRGPARTLIS